MRVEIHCESCGTELTCVTDEAESNENVGCNGCGAVYAVTVTKLL